MLHHPSSFPHLSPLPRSLALYFFHGKNRLQGSGMSGRRFVYAKTGPLQKVPAAKYCCRGSRSAGITEFGLMSACHQDYLRPPVLYFLAGKETLRRLASEQDYK